MLTLLTLGLRKVGRYSHTYQQATALFLWFCLVCFVSLFVFCFVLFLEGLIPKNSLKHCF